MLFENYNLIFLEELNKKCEKGDKSNFFIIKDDLWNSNNRSKENKESKLLLFKQFYNDIRLWWIITTANKDIIGRDSFGIKPGLEIRIPGNVLGILNLFERINK